MLKDIHLKSWMLTCFSKFKKISNLNKDIWVTVCSRFPPDEKQKNVPVVFQIENRRLEKNLRVKL